jgi:hypothetical protein
VIGEPLFEHRACFALPPDGLERNGEEEAGLGAPIMNRPRLCGATRFACLTSMHRGDGPGLEGARIGRVIVSVAPRFGEARARIFGRVRRGAHEERVRLVGM